MASSRIHAPCRNSARGSRAGAQLQGIDRELFLPLSEHLCATGPLKELEGAFRSGDYPTIRNIGRPNIRDMSNQVIGFLFETYIQLALSSFSEIDPRLSILRSSAGVFEDGRSYVVNERGSAVFYRPNGTEKRRTLAEIDGIGEFQNPFSIVPVIFEITLRSRRHMGEFKARRKSRIVEDMYGSSPHFTIIRPAVDGERPGLQVCQGPGNTSHRELLVPRNDALRDLCGKIIREARAGAHAGGEA